MFVHFYCSPLNKAETRAQNRVQILQKKISFFFLHHVSNPPFQLSSAWRNQFLGKRWHNFSSPIPNLISKFEAFLIWIYYYNLQYLTWTRFLSLWLPPCCSSSSSSCKQAVACLSTISYSLRNNKRVVMGRSERRGEERREEKCIFYALQSTHWLDYKRYMSFSHSFVSKPDLFSFSNSNLSLSLSLKEQEISFLMRNSLPKMIINTPHWDGLFGLWVGVVGCVFAGWPGDWFGNGGEYLLAYAYTWLVVAACKRLLFLSLSISIYWLYSRHATQAEIHSFGWTS